MKRFIIIAISLLVASFSAAQTCGPFPSYNFSFTEASSGNTGYYDTSGRIPRNCHLPDPAKKQLILFVDGQSNVAGYGGEVYIPINSGRIDNLNIMDGGCYPITGPLLGPTWNTFGPGGAIPAHLADILAGSGWDFITLVPVAITTTVIGEWGAHLNDRLCAGMARLASLGITPSTPGVTFVRYTGIGESDAIAGTSQASFQASYLQTVAELQACGFMGRSFLRLETYYQGTINTTIRAAQAAVVDGVTIFQGGDTDTIGAAGRPQDNIHLVDLSGISTGATDAAAKNFAAMHASGAPF